MTRSPRGIEFAEEAVVGTCPLHGMPSLIIGLKEQNPPRGLFDSDRSLKLGADGIRLQQDPQSGVPGLVDGPVNNRPKPQVRNPHPFGWLLSHSVNPHDADSEKLTLMHR